MSIMKTVSLQATNLQTVKSRLYGWRVISRWTTGDSLAPTIADSFINVSNLRYFNDDMQNGEVAIFIK